jgi:uncharacterized protein (TIGR02145 family)
MKYLNNSILYLALLSLVLIGYSCEKDSDSKTPNEPPTLLIVSPQDGATFKIGANVKITVNAIDSDGEISKVEIFANSDLLGSVESPPYSIDWEIKNISVGNHIITATAYDNDGDKKSAEITIKIEQQSACAGITEIGYGGQIYQTVEIGNQCWLKQNINIQAGNSWCYDNDPEYCDKYGRLYDWSTALTVCPEGWHLPSDDEWKTLFGFADSQYEIDDPIWNGTGWRGFDAGKKLKSTSGWGDDYNGTDDFGFSGLPAGYWDNYFAEFYDGDDYGYWWTSTQESLEVIGYDFGYDNDQIYRGSDYADNGRSVRCIKD